MNEATRLRAAAKAVDDLGTFRTIDPGIIRGRSAARTALHAALAVTPEPNEPRLRAGMKRLFDWTYQRWLDAVPAEWPNAEEEWTAARAALAATPEPDGLDVDALAAFLHQKGIGCDGHAPDSSLEMHRDDAHDIRWHLAARLSKEPTE